MHGMMGRGAYTPEQLQKYDAIVAEFAKQMEPIKDQMFIKRQELRALQNAANPDIAAVRATATEMLQLRKQLGQMHETMAQRLEKKWASLRQPCRKRTPQPRLNISTARPSRH